jgi:hypothetical protein
VIAQRLAPNAIALADLTPDALAQQTRTAVALARAQLGATVDVAVVQATEKSQVFRVATPRGCFALKLHASPGAFANELACHRRLAGLGVTPRLESHQVRARCLITEWVAAGSAPPDPLGFAAHWLGVLHGALQRRAPQAARPLEAYRDATIASPASGGARSNAERCGGTIDDLVAIYGSRYRPCAIGDLKVDHLICAGEAAWWIDLETFTDGAPGLVDLVMLVNFATGRVTREQALGALDRYLEGHARYLPLRTTSAAVLEALDRHARRTVGTSLLEAWSA